MSLAGNQCALWCDAWLDSIGEEWLQPRVGAFPCNPVCLSSFSGLKLTLLFIPRARKSCEPETTHSSLDTAVTGWGRNIAGIQHPRWPSVLNRKRLLSQGDPSKIEWGCRGGQNRNTGRRRGWRRGLCKMQEKNERARGSGRSPRGTLGKKPGQQT